MYMNQFNSDYFVFDGIDSEDMGIMMCTIGDSTEDLVLGLNRTVNQSDSIGDIKILKNVSNEYHTFAITLTKVDTLPNGKKVLGKFTPQELSFIQRWLFKNEYRPFIPKNEYNSLIYYVLFTGESGFLNEAKQGYLTFTMSVYPYAYEDKKINTITIKSEEVDFSQIDNIFDVTTITEWNGFYRGDTLIWSVNPSDNGTTIEYECGDNNIIEIYTPSERVLHIVFKDEEGKLFRGVRRTDNSFKFIVTIPKGAKTFMVRVSQQNAEGVTIKMAKQDPSIIKLLLLNETNVNGCSFTDINLEMIHGIDIKINNLTNGSNCAITNMLERQKLIFHGKQQYIEAISNENNIEETNLYMLSNREFIYLSEGKNEIEVELLGEAKISFSYQIKMSIY